MRQIWRPALLVAALVGLGLFVHTMPGGAGGLVARAGTMGMPAFVALSAGLCAIGMPRQLAAYAGAAAFGFWPGVVLALAAQMIGCAFDLLWARLLGRDWAQTLMRRKLGGRLARIDAFLAATPFTATLTLRLLPIGNNLALNLLAGVSGIAALPFLAASALGYLPQTLIFGLLGAGTRVDQTTQLAFGAALFACSTALGAILMRGWRAEAQVTRTPTAAAAPAST